MCAAVQYRLLVGLVFEGKPCVAGESLMVASRAGAGTGFVGKVSNP